MRISAYKRSLDMANTDAGQQYHCVMIGHVILPADHPDILLHVPLGLPKSLHHWKLSLTAVNQARTIHALCDESCNPCECVQLEQRSGRCLSACRLVLPLVGTNISMVMLTMLMTSFWKAECLCCEGLSPFQQQQHASCRASDVSFGQYLSAAVFFNWNVAHFARSAVVIQGKMLSLQNVLIRQSCCIYSSYISFLTPPAIVEGCQKWEHCIGWHERQGVDSAPRCGYRLLPNTQ